MGNENIRLTRPLKDERKRAAAVMLAQGRPMNEVSRIAGIDQKTLYNWRKGDNEFQLALSRELYDINQEAVIKLHSRLDEYIEIIHSIATNPEEKTTERLKAIDMAARLVGKFHEQDDFKRRLAIADAVQQYQKYQETKGVMEVKAG